MKSRGLKDFRKEQELQNALFQYQLYEAVMNDMMKQAITAMIAVCEKRRYKKSYIQRFFNDIVMVLEMPEIFGQQMCSNEMMAEYAEKYDLDFDRINVNTETLDDYCKRYKIKR
jgi:hypothetical protein